MGHSHASSPSRARTALALASAALIVLRVEASPRASGATPVYGTGETGPARPITAPVDPSHATVEAARAAALSAHTHGHLAAASPSSAPDTQAGTVTAAALD